MNIGLAADHSGLPPKTIRYYEDIGLIRADRHENGYRDYSNQHIHKLRFLQRSRSLGFTIEECRQLLALYEDRDRASADVKTMALERIADIERKIRELTELRDTLSHLAKNCHGDARPDCPILEGLSR